jgi:lipopolysaccharide assembly outer membrane protein LptD (OstA)
LYLIHKVRANPHFNIHSGARAVILLSFTTAKIAFILLLICFYKPLIAQEPEIYTAPDTVYQQKDIQMPDTLYHIADTLRPETPQNDFPQDTALIQKEERFALDAKVMYKSADSLYFDLANNKTFLYHNAEIQYQNINLKADYVEIDFSTNILYASGLPDSVGVMKGTPVFTESGQSFMSSTMSYNFDSRRGYIRDVITQEGDGFLHGRAVKKMEDDITNVRHGSFTTCNLDCPHYEFRYQKAKVIPSDKIVTGPVYLVIEDVPLPLVIPFGFFPNKKGQTSGIIVPTYGESDNRGFYFENGGYYWGVNDYMELYLRGDIYTRGSWAVKPNLIYRKRYKYNGGVNLSYANNVIGEEGTPSFQKSKDFSIRWNHNQDPKAHPTRRISANVNIQTSKFNRFNPVSSQNYLSNTFQSSISYQRSFAGKYFLNASATHSQNTLNNSVTMTLPDVSFNVNRFYPFRRKTRVGALRWYEDISVNYTMNARNQVSTVDSLMFRPETLNDFRNGVKHSIPITSNIKLLKHFNLTNSVNFTERWYSQRVEQKWISDEPDDDGNPVPGFVRHDTLSGFYGVRDFSYNASLNTTLYGMMLFKKGPLRAVRHVMNPSVGFSYRPDFGAEFWNYYGEVQTDSAGNTKRYSYYQGSTYGIPPDGESGSLNFSLGNNLEIKIRSKRDTVSGERKIKLIDNLSISGSYDMARDSLQWSSLSVSGRTTLFKNLQIQYSGRWNPYAIDSTGRLLNKFVWETERKILRRENTSWNFSMRYNLNQSTFGGKDKSDGRSSGDTEFGTEEEMAEVMMYPDQFIDWNQPWSLSIDYSLRLTNQYRAREDKFERTTVQSINFQGDVNVTPKWKIGFRSGYDFVDNKFTYTSFNFYRDLHCWEMRLNWIPTGGMKSWNFQINVKSQMLQDLKLTRKKDFRDF